MLHLEGKETGRDLPTLRELIARLSSEQIIKTVKAVIGSDAKGVRQMSIYLCHRFSEAKLRDLGMYFDIRESAISEASRRFSFEVGNGWVVAASGREGQGRVENMKCVDATL